MSQFPDPPGPAATEAPAGGRGAQSIADVRLPVALLPALAAEQAAMWTLKDVSTGRYLAADTAFLAWIGLPAERLPGATDTELFDGHTALMLRTADQTAAAQPAPLWSEHHIERADGARDFRVLRAVEGVRLASVWIDVAPARQRERQLRAALEQVEQLQRANAELRRDLADHGLRDPASGLNTRAHYQEQLRREVDLSQREHREFAMVLIELDAPTDAARAAGEAGRAHVLEAVGRLLRNGTRAMDTSCRWDADRFAVLLSGVGLATAHARMEGLRRRCATQLVLHGGVELGFSVSMGVASFPHTAQTLDQLVDAADAALAEARRRGGNHVTLAGISLGG